MLRQLLRTIGFTLFSFFCFVSISSATGDGWMTNVAEAIKQAQAENKDLLMDFSGSDWCHWCIQLDKEVFSDDTFQDAVENAFVLVELDFPNDESLLSAKTKKQNHRWREKLQIEGFPSVILLDKQGRPYAKTGYRPGGPSAYVAHLKELQQIRVKRDRAFAAAESATGAEKAKRLDEALQTMSPEFVYSNYLDTVKSIVALDIDNSGGMKEKYKTGLDRLQISKELQAMMQRFRPERAEEYIEKIKAVGRKYRPTGRLKMELSGMLAQLYLMSEREEEALELSEAYSRSESLHPDERVQWQMLSAAAFAQQRKVDAAIAVLDGITKEHSQDKQIVMQCTIQKIQTLAQNQRIDEAEKIVSSRLLAASGEEKAILEKFRSQLSEFRQRQDGSPSP